MSEEGRSLIAFIKEIVESPRASEPTFQRIRLLFTDRQIVEIIQNFARHWVGSNFVYFLRDPAGNFTEYYSDMDEILDDQLWEPVVFNIADLTRIQDWGTALSPIDART